MVKVSDVIEEIEAKWAPSYALEWDNVGLLVGSMEKATKHILVALDATDEVVAQAIEIGADMIISHHPMIFSPIKRITTEDFLGRRIITLIKNDITCYAAHTNFDVKAMGQLNEESLALKDAKVLQVTASEDVLQGIGRIGQISKPTSLLEFSKYVKQQLGVNDIRTFGNPQKEILTVAISGGSGSSMVEVALKAGADVLVTGDISHGKGLDAMAAGMAIIDAGHYGTEHIFTEYVRLTLATMFPDVTVTAAKEAAPFWTV
jgi:dinuclear metal center protein, YbgI/SA1388 family